jgi:hypothetical protein
LDFAQPKGERKQYAEKENDPCNDNLTRKGNVMLVNQNIPFNLSLLQRLRTRD